MIAAKLGVDTTSVAAIIASGGVAIGLALQGSLSNFAGGVLILLLKPFEVGDILLRIQTTTKGTVKEIQIFLYKGYRPLIIKRCDSKWNADQQQSDKCNG